MGSLHIISKLNKTFLPRKIYLYKTTMSALEIYGFAPSPPARAVHMTLDLLGLEYKFHDVNVLEGATKTPDFLALNPQHTVPVLTDGNLVITESRAAMTYLVSQYKPGQLYPACAKKRSQIDQRLYFNIVTLYKRLGDCVYPVCFGQQHDLSRCGLFVNLLNSRSLQLH